jgi:AcrR family transcriptional regulator
VSDESGIVQVLWGSLERPRRGPKPGLTVERIARAAIEIADTEGLSAVSMQRVATGLGVTKMALYRYVPGKAELVALMTETAVGPPPEAEPSAGWREILARWALRLYSMFEAHPWLPEVTSGLRIMGPNELGWLDQVVGALAGTGLDGAERMDAAAVLSGHVRSIAQQSLGADGRPRRDSDRQLMEMIGRLLAQHAERFPALTSAMRDTSGGAQDNALDFGVNRILDGIAALIAQRAGRSGP